jgi:RNA polymerase sigma factor (TIGR02999 family)
MQDEITILLDRLRAGDTAAGSRLAVVVGAELNRTAEPYWGRQATAHTFQALVDDAYLRLVPADQQNAPNRSNFYAVAVKVMRRVLIDHARGPKPRPSRWRVLADVVPTAADLAGLDWALSRLAQHDERLARIAEMKFVAGQTEEEIAQVLGISPRTVKREIRVAVEWLRNERPGGDEATAGGVR